LKKRRALERRFQKILVGEPTVETTIAILRGTRTAPWVQITIPASWPTETRYRTSPTVFLPDKAIDLIDRP
jgi:ATP-dependent Clp protease ATP-binding subunit ClpB